jgi:hypothetical protein
LHGGKAGLAKGGMRVAHQRWGESPTTTTRPSTQRSVG